MYGFIRIPSDLIYDIIEHPYFQRLRRIKQLGLTHLVYPGAMHTRFAHALGAMHLMQLTLHSLKEKGVAISKEEQEGALIAILLHDIGHGPFSHALEHAIIPQLPHEKLSLWFITYLNDYFDGKLTIALSIFKNEYPRKFLYELVNSQLDMDRLDYLNRDSFFTGVSEGIVGWDRIINMLHVVDDQLVVEEKGIYSLEKFLVARRLMYWQVYLHKTSISAESMLLQVLKRARYVYEQGYNLPISPALKWFFDHHNVSQTQETLAQFAMLDDTDLAWCMKNWQNVDDAILSFLTQSLVHRKLPKTKLYTTQPAEKALIAIKNSIISYKGQGWEDWLLVVTPLKLLIYDNNQAPIRILKKNGEVTQLQDYKELTPNFPYSQNEEKYAVTYYS